MDRTPDAGSAASGIGTKLAHGSSDKEYVVQERGAEESLLSSVIPSLPYPPSEPSLVRGETRFAEISFEVAI
jgi:hypothetical protein